LRAVVGGDEAPRKPDPQGLLRLCAQLGAAPAEALLVGDSSVDAQTAANAGVPFCAVLWGMGSERELRAARPAYVAETASDLSSLLRRLSAP